MHTLSSIPGSGPQTLFQQIHEQIERAVPANNYLLGGKLGLVLYYFSLYEAFGNDVHADKSIQLLEELMNQEEDEPFPLSGTGFATGTAGLGYVLSILQQAALVDIDLQSTLAELDESIFRMALQQAQQNKIDFLTGAMGPVHYFTTRGHEPLIRQYLEKLVNAICSNAVTTEKGSWFRTIIFDEKEKDRADLGLSHGNTGFLLLLLNAMEKGILVNELESIIESGITFILSRQLEINERQGQYTAFPFSVNDNSNTDDFYTQRLGWCYGDLNIILLLYRAAHLLHKPEWAALADRLADKTLTRTDIASTLIEDAHFCHGSAGLVQLYTKLRLISGNEKFGEAAAYWMNRTLAFSEEALNEGTFSGRECDLLNGWLGINLVLITYISKKDLPWSRSLLV